MSWTTSYNKRGVKTRKKRGGFSYQKQGYVFLKRKKMKYSEYLNTDHWKKLSLKYKRKFPRCETCMKNKSEHVHHKNYYNLGKEKYWDLISICSQCHKKKHNIE